jgi:hypothetical protein
MNEVIAHYNNVRAFLFQWLTSALPGYPVIMDNQHDPRPQEPHVSFNYLTGFRKVGTHDERIQINNVVYLSCVREFTVTIRAIGHPINGSYPLVNPAEMLDAVQSSLDLDANVALFRAAGVSVVDSLGVINTTALEENAFRPSAVLDVIMRTRYLIEQSDATFIDTVIISGTVENPGGDDIEYGPSTVSVAP